MGFVRGKSGLLRRILRSSFKSSVLHQIGGGADTQAFGGIAERAERIGSLNISPELLQSLLGSQPVAEVDRGRRN